MNAAHFHLMLNHIPVLGAIATLVLLLVARITKAESLLKLTLACAIVIGLLTIPAFVTGEPSEEIIESLPGFSESLVERHENLALAGSLATGAMALAAAYGLIMLGRGARLDARYWYLFSAIAVGNAVLMMTVANFGGQIRHPEIRSGASDAPVEVAPGQTSIDSDED